MTDDAISTAGAHPIPTADPIFSGGDVSVDGAAGSWEPAVGSNTIGTLGVAYVDDAPEVGYVGPVASEDGACVGVDFREGNSSPTGSFEAKVKPSDTAEERGVRKRRHAAS